MAKRFSGRMVLSLRATMVLVLLVSAGMGWYAREARVQRRAVERIKAAGGFVYYDWQWDRSTDEIDHDAAPPEPAWVAQVLPIDLLHSSVYAQYFSDRGVDDPALTSIAQLGGLESLTLSGPSVTDAALRDLKRLRRLKCLSVVGANITGAGLAELRTLPSLSTLSADFVPPLTEDDLAVLQSLPHLRSLTLYSPLSDRGLAHIGRIKHLRAFKIVAGGPAGGLTDAGLAQLAHLRQLKELQLRCYPISDHALEYLSKSVELETLHLSRKRSCDMRLLCGLRGLKHLSIADRLDDAGIDAIGCLRELETLELDNCQITDAGVERICQLRNLVELALSDPQLTDTGVQRICQLGNLVKLTVRSNRVTDASVGALSSLKRCRYLCLPYTKISKAGVRRLRRALPGCKVVTDT